MDSHHRQLPVPSPALDDERAVELVRIWLANGRQHISLATGLWKDPASWGIVLVDLAKHIANAYAQTTEDRCSTILGRIKDGFDAEWTCETDQPTGDIVE